MLFSRLLDPSCSYCRFGRPIGGGEIACVKRGITSENGHCRKFKYDPLRRVPERRQHPLKGIMPPDMEETPEADPPDEHARMQAEIDRLRSALFQPQAPAPVKEAPSETPEAALIAESAAHRLAQAKQLEEKVSSELAKEFAPEVMPAETVTVLEPVLESTPVTAEPAETPVDDLADAPEPEETPHSETEPEEPAETLHDTLDITDDTAGTMLDNLDEEIAATLVADPSVEITDTSTSQTE